MHSVEFETHPALFVTQPIKNSAHYASVVKVIGACSHVLFSQATYAPVIVVDQQTTPAVVIAEQVACKPKYVEHPPLVQPVLPFQ